MKFAFLNIENHPRGNYMLRRIVEAGYVPSMIIEEESDTGRSCRDTLSFDIARPELCPTLDEITGIEQVPRIRVADHNGMDCADRLSVNKFDYVVLGDTPGRLRHTGQSANIG